MDLISDKSFDHIKVTVDKGSILIDDTHIIPVGDSPLPLSSSINIVSGWPLRGIFPNRLYDSRIRLDASMLAEDLAITNGKIHIPQGIRWDDDLAKYHSVVANLNISNLNVSWNMDITKCSLSIGDNQNVLYP